MSIKTILFLLFSYLSILHSFAQSPYFRQITDREGLPNMTVYDIYQSKKGYIWVGTGAGIYRYDGLHFKAIQIPNSQGKSFANIQEDSQGNIYCINFIGQFFRINNDKTYEIALPKSLNKQKFRSYLIDPNDNIWLCAEKLYFKPANSPKWQALDLQGQPVKSIQIGGEGNVWVLAYHNNIFQVSPVLKILQHIKTPENMLFISVLEQEIKAVSLEDNHFYSYDFKTQQWTRIWQNIEDKITDQIIGFQQDKKGNYWILTYEGVILYQEKNKQCQRFLKDTFVSRMKQDFEGNYWFTTLGKGLFVLANLEGLHYNQNNSALNFEQINCLEEDDLGNLYIGTNGNRLFYLDTQTEKIEASYQLPLGDVECLLLDKKRQKLYVENDVLQIFDLVGKAQTDKIKLGNTPKALAIYQNKFLVVVAGDISLIYSLNPKEKTKVLGFGTEHYDKISILARKRGRAVCVENSQKRFWIAYADGLYYYENGKSTEVKTLDNQSITAISLQADAEGNIWVGTTEQGIFGIKNKKIFKHLTRKKGLISNFCKVKRDKKFLYIGTDKGLQVYHIKTGQSRVFNQEDGLPSNEIRDLIVQENKIYLASNKGLSVLNKDFSTTNHKPPLIYLTGFEVWDKAQKLKDNYQLEYNQNNLTIRFTGLAFRSGGKFRYKYRMQGLDKKWTYSGSSNSFARYSALPSGSYQFEVKAINEDGIASKTTASIKIEIAYPIWEKWWFISLIILLSSGIVAAIVLNRLRAIRRKTQMEKALGKATLESLKLQMNPHFLFNAMSAIQRYMIRNDAPKASNYLAQFSKLMRAVLENSRSEYISLEQEIEMLENYLTLQQLQHKGNFQYSISLDEALDPEEIAIPPMFAQPFIENAIEHGIAQLEREGLIEISFDLKDDFILLKIKDNGIGFEKSKENTEQNHQSLATQITQERIRLYKQSLNKNIIFAIKSNHQGTEILFHLPYKSL